MSATGLPHLESHKVQNILPPSCPLSTTMHMMCSYYIIVSAHRTIKMQNKEIKITICVYIVKKMKMQNRDKNNWVMIIQLYLFQNFQMSSNKLHEE
jgi:hypothetical protein